MRIFITFLCLLKCLLVHCQSNIELDSLTDLLEHVYQKDQAPRIQLDSIQNKYGYISAEAEHQWRLIKNNDSANIQVVKSVLDNYGWLSERETSKAANAALFLVIQHADIEHQVRYINTLKNAVETGKAKPADYAYLLDRVNVRQGRLQVYGSQISVSTSGKSYFYPIKDESNVNKRRKEVGLPPLEKVALAAGFAYKAPHTDAVKNKVVVTGFVIETDQTPIANVKIMFGSKAVATTDSDGFYLAVIEKGLLNQQLAFTKKGYAVSDPPLKEAGKEVYELSIMLTKN